MLLSVGSDGGWLADEGVADGARVGCHAVLARQPPFTLRPSHPRALSCNPFRLFATASDSYLYRETEPDPDHPRFASSATGRRNAPLNLSEVQERPVHYHYDDLSSLLFERNSSRTSDFTLRFTRRSAFKLHVCLPTHEFKIITNVGDRLRSSQYLKYASKHRRNVKHATNLLVHP
ncbi:hypothetical protein PUN28_000568 [Cardiocondyla obscurior]|uniref:Uncharacterized protein n=1 Tax=Cardiocondyla obscurior TaxID=286306 RepID=A0AAW2H0N5_9HYME